LLPVAELVNVKIHAFISASSEPNGFRERVNASIRGMNTEKSCFRTGLSGPSAFRERVFPLSYLPALRRV
jgi:hypothetical protein